MKSLSKFKKESLFFGLITLSGILPIMISSTQRGFYILTVYPFISVSLALLIATYVDTLVDRISSKGLRILGGISVSILAVAVTLSGVLAGTVRRDRKLIEDSRAIVSVVGENSVIGIPGEILKHWSLHGYLARYGNVGLKVTGRDEYPYYLTGPGTDLSTSLEPVDVSLNNYTLYRKNLTGSEQD